MLSLFTLIAEDVALLWLDRSYDTAIDVCFVVRIRVAAPCGRAALPRDVAALVR